MVEKVTKFLKEVRFEMERVHWPSWGETRQATILVIVSSFFASLAIGLVDIIVRGVVSQLIGG